MKETPEFGKASSGEVLGGAYMMRAQEKVGK